MESADLGHVRHFHDHFGFTVVNIAFPTLRREFGASLADAQWVLSIYVLSLGVTTPVSGYLADRFGIKRMYLWGFRFLWWGRFCAGWLPRWVG